MIPKISNVVTTAELNQRIDITTFRNYRWGMYDQDFYGGRCGYVKDEKIEGRVTIFLSGKMISVGAKDVAKSIEQLENAKILLLTNRLAKNTYLEPKVRNIVASLNLEKTIDLDNLFRILENCEYEPKTFPAIIYRHSKGTCLLFRSGKIMINGAKSETQIIELVNEIKKLL